MITPDELAEAAPAYEEWLAAEDPGAPEALQARLLFRSVCRRVLDREDPSTKEKFPLEAYIAAFITPELNRFLSRRASDYPTIQPERRQR